MRKPIKLVILMVLGMLTAHFSMVASFAQDSANGLSTETTALENFYKQKAENYLNKLVDPKDYTLVVTANIRDDEQRLEEYREAVEKKFLPGLIIKDPLGFSDAHNILLGLKSRVEVQIVLSDRAPEDRDALIRDVLKTNLKLNEETGDTVTVMRAARTIASINPADDPAKLPELSTRMIAFWIILVTLAMTALAFWFYRRKEKSKQEAKDNALDAIDANATELNQEKNADEEEEEEKEREKTPEEIEAERDALEMKLAFAKGELIKLVTEYPSIVCRAAEEFASQGRLPETVTFLEALGWEQSKRLFKEIEGRMWTRIGAALRERDEDPDTEEVYEAVHVFHRFALSFVLERAGRDTENPFSFIFQLTDSQRLDLLTHEKSENIALISIYCSGPQMGELLTGLEPQKQNEVLLHIAKIKQLPEAIVKESVDALLMRLERIKADPSVYVDGPTLAADFIRSLAAIREEELYQMLVETHPDEAEKIRRVRVMFQDIPYYPQDTVRSVIESYESEELLKALVGFDAEFTESFLSLLPTKKALMIQNDLYHMGEFPPASQCAEFRRKICLKLEHELESQRFSIPEYWSQFDEDQEGDSSNEVTAVMDLNEDQPIIFDDDEAEGSEVA